MNQEHETNRPKDLDNEISLWNLPKDCLEKHLLKLAHRELDMTVRMVFVQIRDIAWTGDEDPQRKLHKIGIIADAFHNWGANPPHKLIQKMLDRFAITMIIRKRFVPSIYG
jgi:hypothetical protein